MVKRTAAGLSQHYNTTYYYISNVIPPAPLYLLTHGITVLRQF
jgi:hypothetical protein